MATSLTLENDISLAQGYLKVNGSTAATLTTSGITANITGNVTGSLTSGGSLTLATAQTASGTAVDFTGIPSWAKRITVMFSGVSTNGSSNPLIQIGAGSFVTSGYLGSSVDGPTLTGTLFTTGFGLRVSTSSAVIYGNLAITTLGSNFWSCSGNLTRSDSAVFISTAGGVTLSGALDRIRITTVNGTDAFDAGTINISFEG
jgi:hypothetical protein